MRHRRSPSTTLVIALGVLSLQTAAVGTSSVLAVRVGGKHAVDVKVQPNSRMVLANSGGARFDPAFSGDGKAVVPFPGIGPTAAVVSWGRWIVVAGVSAGKFAVARLVSHGNLDPAFSD